MKYDSFQKDVLIEAEAELAHEATESLKRIRVPVLVIGGTEDVYFPREYIEEMADVIEGAIIAAELATVVIGGLFSSTLLTLLVVPVMYSVFDRLSRQRAPKPVEVLAEEE